MKITMRGLIFMALAVTGGMAVLAGNARGADDALPTEVQSLIGMRIPDTEQARNELIPGWVTSGFQTFYISPDNTLMRSMVMFKQNDRSIFAIVVRGEKEKYRTILDAQLLPREMLTYYFKNGKFVTKKQWWKFYVATVHCEREFKETIVGLMRPERGKQECSHKTKQVKRAWKIDQESGHISEISPQAVSCSYMGGEYSCDPE